MFQCIYSDPAELTSCIPEKCAYLNDPENHTPIQNPLPAAVVSIIQLVFDDLSNPKLLAGCTNYFKKWKKQGCKLDFVRLVKVAKRDALITASIAGDGRMS